MFSLTAKFAKFFAKNAMGLLYPLITSCAWRYSLCALRF